MTEAITIKNYKELEQSFLFKDRLRSAARDLTVFFLSVRSRMDLSKGCIRILCYHHIFDDERKDFRRQLKYLKNYGDFISLDTAVDIFEKNKKINGRYFCITFDDGYKNCLTNTLDILVENKCIAAFFIPTDYISRGIIKNRDIIDRFFRSATRSFSIFIEFLNWDDCKKLIEAGMTIGSHTSSHIPLSRLNNNEIRTELSMSKQSIEEELKIDCRHFACPYGKPERDFRVPADTIIAKEIGYKSFFTSERGPNYSATDPFKIRRDHVIAKWGNYQLRYFFSKK